MALNGKYPTLLIGLDTGLSKKEEKEWLDLKAKAVSQSSKSEFTDEDRTRLTELESKRGSAVYGGDSGPTFNRIPLILDGNVVPAIVSDNSTRTVNSISYINGDVLTTQVRNSVTITIEARQGQGILSSTFPEVLFMIADQLFSRQDSVPRVSYFGGNVYIPNGFLTSISRQSGRNTNREFVTLDIAKAVEETLVDKLKKALDKDQVFTIKNTSSKGPHE